MVTKYYGCFCVYCKQFMAINSYEVERPEEVRVHFRAQKHGEPLTCPHCNESCVYLDDRIAHSLSPNGDNPHYPNARK